jgi:hypothetical protein
MHTEYAAVAIKLNGYPESAQHVPERQVPWGHDHGKRSNCEQRGIATAHVFLFVSDHKLLLRSFQFQDPVRENYLRVKYPRNQGSGFGSNRDVETIDIVDLRHRPDSVQAPCSAPECSERQERRSEPNRHQR